MSACARGRGGEGRGDKGEGGSCSRRRAPNSLGKKKKKKPVRVRESTKRITGFRLPTYRQEREVLRAGFVSQPGSVFFVCFFYAAAMQNLASSALMGPYCHFHIFIVHGETSSPLESVKSQVTFA